MTVENKMGDSTLIKKFTKVIAESHYRIFTRKLEEISDESTEKKLTLFFFSVAAGYRSHMLWIKSIVYSFFSYVKK